MPAVAVLVIAAAVMTVAGEIEAPPGWTSLSRRLNVMTPDGECEADVIYYRNTLGMEFVWIPGGEYWRGSRIAPGDVQREFGGHAYWYEREHPRHRVGLTDGFWMAKAPVTQAQWMAVMGVNQSFFRGEERPVENVSWNDAVAFARRLSEREGVRYSLPTEAQWEYAARAGTTTEFSFGDGADRLDLCGWYAGNSLGTTHPVGQKKPNPWGLYDMHGQVWEWCLDGFGDYGEDPVTDPAGHPDSAYRVLRGGAWFAHAGNCRSARRRRIDPDHRGRGNGLRVIATASGRCE